MQPIEVVLDYYDDQTGQRGLARTYWHPFERGLGGHAWEPLADRDEAIRLITELRGQTSAEDEMLSLVHRVSLQLQ